MTVQETFGSHRIRQDTERKDEAGMNLAEATNTHVGSRIVRDPDPLTVRVPPWIEAAVERAAVAEDIDFLIGATIDGCNRRTVSVTPESP